MILKAPIKGNMAEIWLNRKSWNLKNKIMDLNVLKSFFSGLICGGGAG